MDKFRFAKKPIIVFCIAVIIIVIISLMVKYQVEGEQNLPFQISKVMMISNATGMQAEEPEHKWDLTIVQNNDIYIDIAKNKNYGKEEIIDKIILENFEIEEKPKKGNIVFYGPQSYENGVYHNEETYEIKDKMELTGNENQSDMKNLQISNQGGLILIRAVNTNLGQYTSDEQEEIRHDGTLIQKIGLTKEDVKFKISFDLSVELKSEKKYKTHIELELPNGNLVSEGITNHQITGVENFVFKRY